MRFLFVFTFHQLVDAWRKFVNGASKVIMLKIEKEWQATGKFIYLET